MDVDEPRKFGTIPISMKEFSPEDGETTNADVHLRGVQEGSNLPQNICIRRRTVVESRGIDESHSSSVESELIRGLDFGRTRLRW